MSQALDDEADRDDARPLTDAPEDDGSTTRAAPWRLVAWAALATAALLAVSMFWLACETHYRSCVEAVDVRTANDNTPLAKFSRQEGVRRCTRSPF